MKLESNILRPPLLKQYHLCLTIQHAYFPSLFFKPPFWSVSCIKSESGHTLKYYIKPLIHELGEPEVFIK